MLAWRITGGTRAFVRSADFVVALAITALCANKWLGQGWWDQAIAIVPSLLGFTLGGFAIFLGFGSDSFREQITTENQLTSPYLSVSAAFLIFVTAQCVALLYALICAALYFPRPPILDPLGPFLESATPVAWGIGYLIFVLSITLSMRAALRIFRLSRWYNSFIVAMRNAEQDGASGGSR
ncbi:hypothetical protein [Ramlibacter sp. Leaf400]|uniref:hypothetical protein n=1 Tax=Ramlibacter sp. Leaf400 TaxID=1736365 RepID=UPI0012E35578|nr:hypothetical protein [Ramlibacter sp. Leaf400]